MEKQQLHTLVDLKDVCVKYITEFDYQQKKYSQKRTINYFFAYPALEYHKYFKVDADITNNQIKLLKIDQQNVDIVFNHIFCFDSKLAPIKQRSEAMSDGKGLKLLDDKYNHCQYFYRIISEFYLKMLTGLKHKNLYKINDQKEVDILDNSNINNFFGFEGKTKLTNEECIQHSLTICNFMTQEIDKIIDILYKKDFDNAIDKAIIEDSGNNEIKNKINKKLNK